jgi:hypothetical protein
LFSRTVNASNSDLFASILSRRATIPRSTTQDAGNKASEQAHNTIPQAMAFALTHSSKREAFKVNDLENHRICPSSHTPSPTLGRRLFG